MLYPLAQGHSLLSNAHLRILAEYGFGKVTPGPKLNTIGIIDPVHQIAMQFYIVYFLMPCFNSENMEIYFCGMRRRIY